MKTLLVFIFFSISIVFCQSADFRYDSHNESELRKNATKITHISSLWLSNYISIKQDENKRLIVKFGYSSYPKKINDLTWVLPDISFGFRLSNNLFTSGRFFGFHLEKDSPQIAGLGIHYTFGEERFWTVSFQRSAINGLNDFRLVSSSFNLEKYIVEKSKFDFFIGIGSNTVINRSYYVSPFLPNKLEKDIKYASLKILYPFRKIKLGLGSQFSSDMLLFNIFILKGFQ
tara:strand:- start:252 stop:941 length:690 start_codon:yes stop_codon:yes gene_type:complete